MSGIEPPDGAADQAYFRALEETLVGLRGKSILLTPEDWQAARRWREASIPLALVQRVMAEVWERRRARGQRGRVSSLRYFGPAVEAAWSTQQQLAASGLRVEAEPPFDPQQRLARLIEALPAEWPRAKEVSARLSTLTGDPETIEADLARMEGEILTAELADLAPAARREIESEIDRALTAARARLAPEELALARQRLVRQRVRQHLRLPLLSLFAPEAGEGEGESEREVRH